MDQARTHRQHPGSWIAIAVAIGVACLGSATQPTGTGATRTAPTAVQAAALPSAIVGLGELPLPPA